MKTYINLKNKSHYLSEISRKDIRIKNPNTFAMQDARRQSLYVRLYYHYQDIIDHGGKCYFYTFTYNNRALPSFNGVPCMRNTDITSLFKNDGFSKKILRKYGYKLEYFVACELGEGKGSRGYAGNPHYHVLFFLRPKISTNYVLTDKAFRKECEHYWQGSARDKQHYRYGICMPGDNNGLVSNFHAISYVAKYVIKDTVYRSLFCQLKTAAINLISQRLSNMRLAQRCLRNAFVKYGSHRSLLKLPDIYERLFKRLYLKDIRNIYCPKCFYSKNLGSYGIPKVKGDKIVVPYGNDIVSTVIPQYYFRKLYCDIVKDGAGNNKYILNSRGKDFALSQFNIRLNKTVVEAKKVLDANRYSLGDTYFELLRVLPRYAEYSFIYRGRYCHPDFTIEPFVDYSHFLINEYEYCDYMDEVDYSYFIRHIRKHGYTTYINHPYFKPYKNLFEKFDLLMDDYYICASGIKQQKYNDNRRIKSYVSRDKFNSFVNSI